MESGHLRGVVMEDERDLNMEARLQALEAQFAALSERNNRVELDKAWETSRFRVFSVSTLTWIVISVVFWIIDVERPLVNAVIPTVGFYLSTQTLPVLKAWWKERCSSE